MFVVVVVGGSGEFSLKCLSFADNAEHLESGPLPYNAFHYFSERLSDLVHKQSRLGLR